VGTNCERCNKILVEKPNYKSSKAFQMRRDLIKSLPNPTITDISLCSDCRLPSSQVEPGTVMSKYRNNWSIILTPVVRRINFNGYESDVLLLISEKELLFILVVGVWTGDILSYIDPESNLMVSTKLMAEYRVHKSIREDMKKRLQESEEPILNSDVAMMPVMNGEHAGLLSAVRLDEVLLFDKVI
jgi:hypothetical protein